MEKSEKLYVKLGVGCSDRTMTRKQAENLGKRLMPADLIRAGFVMSVSRSDIDLHGGTWFRINYYKSY